MINNSSVSDLVAEYSGYIDESDICTRDTEVCVDLVKISERLVTDGDWGRKAADHLVMLSNNYGVFMLRNALALAIATRCEDGKLGF